jgi:hypothetical protein
MNAARDMYNRCKNRVKRLETKYKAKDVSGVTEAATAADESLKQAGELIAAQSEVLHPTKVAPPTALPSKPPVTEAATAADESLKQAGEGEFTAQSEALHPTKVAPPSALPSKHLAASKHQHANVTAPKVAAPQVAATQSTASSSTNLVAASLAPASSSAATSNASTGPTSAREYIDLIEKYMRGEDLSTAEMDNAFHALHLCHQANIIAQHPTYRPWYSDIHLANVIASKRKSAAGKCLGYITN